MNSHWLGYRWKHSHQRPAATKQESRLRRRGMRASLLRGFESLEARRVLAFDLPLAAESMLNGSADVASGADQPDWIGGAFAVIYPPYVGQSLFVDAQLGDGDYTSRDVDLFAFDVLTTSALTFESASVPGNSPTDTMFRLFDRDGNELMFDDDSGAEPGCSRIVTGEILGGRYYLGVSGYNNRYYDPTAPGTGVIGQTGPYRLNFSVHAPLDVGGNTFSTAAGLDHEIGQGEYHIATSRFGGLGNQSNDEVDMFSFTAFRGTLFDFETSFWITWYEADTYLRLFDEAGNVLAFNDDGGEGTFSRIAGFVAPYTGRYYLGVSGYPNAAYDPIGGGGRVAGSVGDYVLYANFTEWSDYPDTRNMAAFLNEDLTIPEKLGNNLEVGAADVDMFSFNALAGDQIHAFTQSTMEPGRRDVDTFLRIFDAAGNQVAYNDDSTTSLFSELNYTFPTDGLYYLGVSGYPNLAYDVTSPATTTGRVLGDYGDYELVVDLTFVMTASIAAPTGGVVSDWVPVIGTASSASLDSWELRAGPTPFFLPDLIGSGSTNVFHDQLGLWNTASVVDGNYYLQLTVSDVPGNTAIVQAGPIIVDNTTPLAVITNPVENEILDGTVTITGTAADANIESWELRYSPFATGPFLPLASGVNNVFDSALGLWDTRQVGNGTRYLRLTVLDQAGNSNLFIRPVEVANPTVISAINLDPRTVINFDTLGNGTLFADAFDGLKTPIGGVYDAVGNLFVADVIAGPAASGSIFKFNTAGVGSSFADVFDGVIAPTAVTIDGEGNLYVAGYLTNQIIKVTPAGVGSVFADAADGVNRPFDVAYDATTGNLFVANLDSRQVLKITPAGAGSVFADSADGLFSPIGVAVDAAGFVYVSDVLRGRVTKFTPAGVGTVFATPAQGLTTPTGMSFDDVGNLYVANYLSDTITKITPAGVGSLFADASDGLRRTFDVVIDIPPTVTLTGPRRRRFGQASAPEGRPDAAPTPSPLAIALEFSVDVTEAMTPPLHKPSAPATDQPSLWSLPNVVPSAADPRANDAVLSDLQLNWLALRWVDLLDDEK